MTLLLPVWIFPYYESDLFDRCNCVWSTETAADLHYFHTMRIYEFD